MEITKTVLITGGSQGLGAAMAEAFAQRGYRVAINCYNADTLENGGRQTAETCRGFGAEAECFVADVSDYEACEKLVKEVVERFGPVGVLINNAGITRDGALFQMSEKQYDDVIAANQKSVFNMTRHIARTMIKQRGGRIINMASVAGVYGNKGQLNYAASKAAVIGMTKTAAKELGGRGITVNAIAPGLIETPMTESLPDALKASMLERVSLGRFGRTQDVVQAALFLAEAAYVTGQTILVDGGLAM